MAINETITATASLTTSGGKNLSLRGNTLIIIDTSNNDVIIDITRDWKTSAASSAYGGLYIKPTLHIYEEIMSRFGGYDNSKRYIFVIAADVVLVADNINVGAVHKDTRLKNNDVYIINNGLILGRGGYGADIAYQECKKSKRVYGVNGGPATYSTPEGSGRLYIDNYGGIAGGGGGGGTSGYWSNSDDEYYSTSIREYYHIGPKNPGDSGSGAPFGLRSQSDYTCGSIDILDYQNKNQLRNGNPFIYDFSNAPTNYIQRANGDNQPAWDYLNLEVNPKDMKFVAYANYNLNRLETRDEAFPFPTRWFTQNQQDNINANWYRTWASLVRNDDPTKASIKRAWIYETGYYSNANGASVPTVGWAGLFRGAKGSVIARSNVSYDNWSSAYLCQTQSAVNDRMESIRGSDGGDLGKTSALKHTTAFTDHRASRGVCEVINGITGWNVKANKNNSETAFYVEPAPSGDPGANSYGTVVITNKGSGVVGGDAVLNKYDPNGTFDANARGSNYSLTFEGSYYGSIY